MTGGAPRAAEVRLFVYGTLRGGGTASHLLAGCRPEGVAEVAGTMYDVGGRYPAVTLGGARRVEGEVWRCPEALLQRLDRYEGVGEGLFRRVEVEVRGEECWIYVAGPRLEAHLRPERVVPEGRWPAA